MKSCRLIYKSLAAPVLLENGALQALLNQCVTNNERLGIKGLLLVSGERILQVLEGPPQFVNELFRRIVADDRHSDVELVSYEGQGGTHFYDWSMRLVELDKLDAADRRWFMQKYPTANGKIVFPDDLILLYALLLDAQAIPSSEEGP
jgi:hypothetical protein